VYKVRFINIAFHTPDALLNSVVHVPRDNLLIAGGKYGMMYIMDIRKTNTILNKIKTNEHAIKSFAYNKKNNALFSSYSNGEIKVFYSNRFGILKRCPLGRIRRRFRLFLGRIKMSLRVCCSYNFQAIHSLVYVRMDLFTKLILNKTACFKGKCIKLNDYLEHLEL
jgi:hypothetical protein